MAPEDSKAPFMRIPWAARMLSKPITICRVPGSRRAKPSTEDTLIGDTINSARTIRSCISFYDPPPPDSPSGEIASVSTLMTIGDGLNGHPEILHGGITATLCDESMGIFQSVYAERAHMKKVKSGHAEGELPSSEVTSFTAELTIKYYKPVRTPGCVLLTSTRVKQEGRKQWLRTELKQVQESGEDDEGEAVLCAVGEGLFIQPREKGAKL